MEWSPGRRTLSLSLFYLYFFIAKMASPSSFGDHPQNQNRPFRGNFEEHQQQQQQQHEQHQPQVDYDDDAVDDEVVKILANPVLAQLIYSHMGAQKGSEFFRKVYIAAQSRLQLMTATTTSQAAAAVAVLPAPVAHDTVAAAAAAAAVVAALDAVGR